MVKWANKSIYKHELAKTTSIKQEQGIERYKQTHTHRKSLKMKYHFIKMYGTRLDSKNLVSFQLVYSIYTKRDVRNAIIIGLTANENNVKSGLWTCFLIFYHYYCYYNGDYDYKFNKWWFCEYFLWVSGNIQAAVLGLLLDKCNFAVVGKVFREKCLPLFC